MGVVFHAIAMFMFSIWSTVYNLPQSSISVLLFSDHTKRGVRKTPGIEAVDSCIVDTWVNNLRLFAHNAEKPI